MTQCSRRWPLRFFVVEGKAEAEAVEVSLARRPRPNGSNLFPMSTSDTHKRTRTTMYTFWLRDSLSRTGRPGVGMWPFGIHNDGIELWQLFWLQKWLTLFFGPGCFSTSRFSTGRFSTKVFSVQVFSGRVVSVQKSIQYRSFQDRSFQYSFINIYTYYININCHEILNRP